MIRRALLPVAASLLLTVAACSGGSSSGQSAGQNTPTPSATTSTPTNTHSSKPTSTAATSTSASAAGTTPSPAEASGGPVPAGFKAADLTFVGTTLGFALGTAPCSHQPCTSILRTTDGGRAWVGEPAPVAYLGSPLQTGESNLDCGEAACVGHLRFATAEDGYAFDSNGLYMTTDGSAHWTKEPGGAYSLEAADGNVLRVVATHADECPPGCSFKIESAAPGSASWHLTSAPTVVADGATMARSGATTAVLFEQNPAGGADDEHATLLVSRDGGSAWKEYADPCGNHGSSNDTSEDDGTDVAVGENGEIVVSCQPRAGGHPFLVFSTDGGAGFSSPVAVPAAVASYSVAALSITDTVIYIAAVHDASGPHTVAVYSYDASGWTRRFETATAPDEQPFLGFETTQLGKLLATPTKLFLTTDGGSTWSPSSF